jgi:PPIC-type PPIASE domain
MRFVIAVILAGFVVACGKKDENQSKKIAQIGDKVLYYSEISEVIPRKLSKNDSLDFIQRYRENWIRRQLLYKNAEKNAKIDEKELNKRLEDYKYALITHEFEKQYVTKNFSEKITDQEIKDFYEKNGKEFELRQNIVRAIFIKIGQNNKDKELLSKLMASDKSEDKQELAKYCNEKAVSYHLQDSTWIDFDELTRQTPLEDIPNKINFLKNNKFSEMKEAEFSYVLYVKEYKISEQNAPLEFVKDRIKSMILNERKTLLIKKLEDQLYKDAEKNKEFEIFK